MNYQTRKQIRKIYKEELPYIIENYPRYDPHFCNFIPILTPIERNVWGDIRSVGIPIKCPQFPVLRYFIDFADPIRKIGIEVDSKLWHKNRQQDIKRQKTIENEGWIIYRINGSDTYSEDSEKIIWDIKEKHYGMD